MVGEACVHNYECDSGYCADGVCCNTDCQGECRRCDGVDTVAPAGECAYVEAGHDPSLECTSYNSCNGTGACYAGVNACIADYACVSGDCCDSGGGGYCISGWESMTSPVAEDITDVWGSSSSNVLAVTASGKVLTYNGNNWSVTYNGTKPLSAIHGSSATLVMAVGAGGVVLKFNGTSWATMTSNTTANLNDVWMAGPASAYAVGDGGVIMAWTSTGGWVAEVSGVSVKLVAVTGSGSTVYVGGGRDRYGHTALSVRQDGTWQPTDYSGYEVISLAMRGAELLVGRKQPLTFPPLTPAAVARLSDGEWLIDSTQLRCSAGLMATTERIFSVCGGGELYQGGSWQLAAGVVGGLDQIWAASDCEAFAVGTGGAIARYH